MGKTIKGKLDVVSIVKGISREEYKDMNLGTRVTPKIPIEKGGARNWNDYLVEEKMSDEELNWNDCKEELSEIENVVFSEKCIYCDGRGEVYNSYGFRDCEMCNGIGYKIDNKEKWVF